MLRSPNSAECAHDLEKVELRLRRLDTDDVFSPSERELEHKYFTHWQERLRHLLAKERAPISDTAQKSPNIGRVPPKPIKTSDESWKVITPHRLFRAVVKIRDDFERVCDVQRDFFKAKCFKDLHSLGPGMTEPMVFKGHFDTCTRRIAQVVAQFFARFLEISLGQSEIIGDAPVHWASLQITDLIECEDRLVEGWIKSVCDEQNDLSATGADDFFEKIVFRADWRAPQWLIMQPNGNSRYDASSAWERMNESDTKRVLRYLRENRWILILEVTLEHVAGKAHETLAKGPGSSQNKSTENVKKPLESPKNVPKPLLLKYRSGIKRSILRALAENPQATDAQVCRFLDADGGEELPAGWKNRKEDRSFFAAYANLQTKHKIEIAISKIRRDLRERALLK